MKKTFSILLLGILFFNCIGFWPFYMYFENRANSNLEKQLDNNNYDESELISVKAPARHLAYYNNSSQFERVNGETEIDGVQYKYVKKRLHNDTLEFLCIRNKEVMNLHSAKDEFFKLVNDMQQNGQDKKQASHPDLSKNLLSDYCVNTNLFDCDRMCFSIKKKSFSPIFDIVSSFKRRVEHPPKYC